MSLPVLLAVAHDRDLLERLQAQLGARYRSDYRVECIGDAEQALALLTELADDGADVALVLADAAFWEGRDGVALDRVRTLHGDAKRALLIEPDAWIDPEASDAIRDAIALGRIDYYVIE